MNKNAAIGGGLIFLALHVLALYLNESALSWFGTAVGWDGNARTAWIALIIGAVLLMGGLRMVVKNKDAAKTAGGVLSLVGFVAFVGGLVSLLHHQSWTQWDGADDFGGYRRQYFFSAIFFFGLFTAMAGSTTIMFKPGKTKSQMWGYALTAFGVIILILYILYALNNTFSGDLIPATTYEGEVSRLFITTFAILGGLFGGFFCAGLILAFIIQEPGDLEDLDLESITGAGPGELPSSSAEEE